MILKQLETFLYVSGRHVSLSRLGHDFAEFSDPYKQLPEIIPMGYSTLFVFQRVFLLTETDGEYQWPPDFSPIVSNETKKIYWLLSATGQVWGDHHYQLLDQARKAAHQVINEVGHPIIGGMLLGSYFWH